MTIDNNVRALYILSCDFIGLRRFDWASACDQVWGYGMRRTFMIFAAASGLLLIPTALLAHHGQAGYATGQPVTVSGTVTNFKFENPHCIVSVEAKDDKGAVQAWQGELTSPNHLIRAGWNAQSLKPGDQITITGWRAKSGANSLWITKTTVNGQELSTALGD